MINSLLIAVALAGPAHAETVAVSIQCEDRAMPCEAAQSVVWHALWDRHAHDALVVERTPDTPVGLLKRQELTTLYEVDIGWEGKSTKHGEQFLFGWAPVVDVREFVLADDRLQLRRSWITWGTMALYAPEVDGDAIVNLPQVALQEAMDLAVKPVEPPVWTQRPDTVRIPVVVRADEEYRAYYGNRWKFAADVRLERASALLARAGIQLEPIDHRGWHSPDTATELDGLLDAFALQVGSRTDVLHVGFTQQTELASLWDGDIEDVGRAYMPGTAVLVADQASLPGTRNGWDEASEATAIAHEVLHALGVAHRDDDNWLMSETKKWTTYRMSDSTVGLARAAAAARFDSDDPWDAFQNLEQAAQAHIVDPEYQLQYITQNLAATELE